VTGSGTISIGSGETLDISGSVASTQTVAFTDGVGLLQLTAAQGFAGTVTGLVGHDIIDLVGLTATSTTYNSTSGLVGVYNGGTLLMSFTAPGLAGPLNVAPDGNGGTALTQELAGTEASVTNVMINGATDTNAHDWGDDDPTVTYSFDPGSDWTAAEEAAFVDGLGLYSAMADITFVQAAPGVTGEIRFVRGAAGSGATTTWTTSGNVPGNLNTATISIDTTQSSWSDLSTVGSYAWMTILHEEGHAIALSHPGNYNETADIATQQMFYTDTHQYSVMSYFDSSYSGANWVSGGTTLYAESPMLYDVSAVQQVYGANTTLLDGGDTFGFDASAKITGDAALAVYNFSTNQPPIVTLWDAGTNNTLDLTGFASASYVDLQAGTFSNVDGLTDNLAIAYGTRIDTALGGAGNDTFVLNTDGDVVNGGGGTNVAVFAGPSADYTLAYNAGTVTVTPLGGGAADTLTDIQTLQFSDGSEPACYLRGTRIRTERGEVAVEDLRPQEDWAITASGHAARVVWVGWRRVDLRRHPRPWDVMPVRIRAGAFGPDQPVRDLLLSPDHAVFVAGALIPVRYLINGATIAQEPRAVAHWFHVELDWHDVLLAEGLAAESYLDTGNRGAFANGGPAVHMHPDFALRIWQAQACAPLLCGGAGLEAVRALLLDRAASLGHAVTGDADLRVVVAGRELRPQVRGRVRRFRVPASARSIRLLSRSAVPAEVWPDGTDRRRLGVAVSRLVYGGEAIALTDPRLGAGWHAAETGGADGAWRWTDGAAELALPGGRRVLDIEVAITERYWLDDQRASVAA
jgi:serralysin